MNPWSFLLKPTNVVIAILAALSAVFGGTAYILKLKNTALTAQNTAQAREAQIYVTTHNQQIKLLTDTIDRQNTSIVAFKQTGDKQVQEMTKVQTKVDNMRITAEQQLIEMRKKPVVNLTCDQSIEFLVQQSKLLKFGAPQ